MWQIVVDLRTTFLGVLIPGLPSQRKSFKINDLQVGISARGDLNPILGFYFPLFSMVFPWGISIRVEICGKKRKQKFGLFWSINVHFSAVLGMLSPPTITGGLARK